MEANKYKGVVEIDILGEKRGFKFGLASMAQLCELQKETLEEVVKRLDNKADLTIQLNFFYTGAVQYAKLFNKEVPSHSEVANWVDHLLDAQKEKIGEIAFESFVDPNVKAPETAGQS